jgi:hypothetical protein
MIIYCSCTNVLKIVITICCPYVDHGYNIDVLLNNVVRCITIEWNESMGLVAELL